MFFPHLVKSIGRDDRVLEIGPGGTPHPRADAFLELEYASEPDARRQRADAGPLRTAKPVHRYAGGRFPFADREFDYVICSHVVEHVEDVEGFMAEMFRVAPRGCLEYPTIHYEYLYNFDVHLNFVRWVGGELLYMPKRDSGLDRFRPVQEVLYRSLQLGHAQLVEDLRDVMFEGFEWLAAFPVRRTERIAELAFRPERVPALPRAYRIAQRAAGRLWRWIRGRPVMSSGRRRTP